MFKRLTLCRSLIIIFWFSRVCRLMVRSIGVGCVFSVEIDSKIYVKKISLSDEAHDPVILEGSIGELKEISIIESSALEFIGENGALRIEVDADMLQGVIENPDNMLRINSKVESHANKEGVER